MLVLDIIDTKTGSLLQYISIALAILLFAFGMISGKDFKISSDVQSILSVLILFNVILSVVAILLCLSCLNIVGAHTVFELEKEEYETHIIAVTLGRRNRYRVAHRLSMVTAVSFACNLLHSGVELRNDIFKSCVQPHPWRAHGCSLPCDGHCTSFSNNCDVRG